MWLQPSFRPSAVFLVLFRYSQTVFVSSLLVLLPALGDYGDSGGWMGGRTGILNLGAQSGAGMGQTWGHFVLMGLSRASELHHSA